MGDGMCGGHGGSQTARLGRIGTVGRAAGVRRRFAMAGMAVVVAGLVAGAQGAALAGPGAVRAAPLLAATGPALDGRYVVVLKAGRQPSAGRMSALGVHADHRYTAALNGYAAR